MLKNLKKIKYTSSYRRSVSKNFKKILLSGAPKSEDIKTISDQNIGKEIREIHDEHDTKNNSENVCQIEERDECSKDICLLAEDKTDNDNLLLSAEDMENIKNDEFRKEIKEWALEFNITQRALKKLMNIVNKLLPNILPADPRTLLQTPVSIEVQKIGDDGLYWHQGLIFCLNKIYQHFQNTKSIAININIDGLPIYKSSKDEFWPILFNITEFPNLKPMTIGIYHGKGKPSSVADFLSPFVEEVKLILENGIIFENGQKLKLKIRCFISDSPARAFIKGIFFM